MRRGKGLFGVFRWGMGNEHEDLRDWIKMLLGLTVHRNVRDLVGADLKK